MSQSIYLDNAATSWPKPPEVQRAIQEYWQELGGTTGRSRSREAEMLASRIQQLRSTLAQLLKANAPREIIFTLNATDSLNLVIHGTILTAKRTGSLLGGRKVNWPLTVAVSHAEHNSILRPLNYWQNEGSLKILTLSTNALGQVDLPRAEEVFQTQQVDMLCVTHASNVTGTINDVRQLGQLCHQHGTLFLLDAAQTVGHLPIDVQEFQCDFLVAAGHKSLLGPLGTGLLYIHRDRITHLDSLRMGGTGSSSDLTDPEMASPMKWEAGNPNLPGLIGLAAAVELVPDRLQSLAETRRVNDLAASLWEGLGQIPTLSLVADPGSNPFQVGPPRIPIISCTCDLLDVASLSLALQQKGITTRSGYHCAPWIHEALQTPAGGTLRFSPGFFNQPTDIDRTLEALKAILDFGE